MTYCDSTHQAKLAKYGTAGLWVGYSGGHPVITFQIVNPKTRKINVTYDMTFPNKSCDEFIRVDDTVNVLKSYEELDDEDNYDSVFMI